MVGNLDIGLHYLSQVSVCVPTQLFKLMIYAFIELADWMSVMVIELFLGSFAGSPTVVSLA